MNSLFHLDAARVCRRFSMRLRITIGIVFVITQIIITECEIYASEPSPELYTKCMSLAIQYIEVDEDLSQLGLKKDDLETQAELALRSAKLFNSKKAGFNDPLIGIKVAAVNNAFSYSIDFYKVVFDPYTERYFKTSTRSMSVVGTHGQSSQFIVDSVRRSLDELILDYLRTNEESCDNRNVEVEINPILTANHVRQIIDTIKIKNEYMYKWLLQNIRDLEKPKSKSIENPILETVGSSILRGIRSDQLDREQREKELEIVEEYASKGVIWSETHRDFVTELDQEYEEIEGLGFDFYWDYRLGTENVEGEETKRSKESE